MNILMGCDIALPILVDIGPVGRYLLLFVSLVAGIVSYVLPVSVDVLAVSEVCRPVCKISRLVFPDRCPVPENILEDIQVVPPVLVDVLVVCANILREVPVLVPQTKNALQ